MFSLGLYGANILPLGLETELFPSRQKDRAENALQLAHPLSFQRKNSVSRRRVERDQSEILG
jgi:hypothetical protein